MADAGDVEANAEEYLTMVAAGLTGSEPHMISASINALSRILFEFKDDISESTISELVATITVFLTSKNREIVKSALGFAKVSIVSLPLSTLQPHLGQLVPALLGWVHDHKNHFKSKTVHIFERLIRRFGFEAVYNAAGEMVDERKVLQGIKKRKERARRKKASKGDESDDDQQPRQSSGNAFDDILYNSDSDVESEADHDEPTNVKAGGKGRRGQQQQQQQQHQLRKGKQAQNAAGGAFIRNEGDEPMDLLSRSIAGGVATMDPSQSRKRKPGQDASHFKTDKSGKLLIDENDSEVDDAPHSRGGQQGEGGAFLSATQGIDGAHRDARGNLKFNKNTKKGREQERDMGEAMGQFMDEDDDAKKKKLEERRKKRKSMGLGEEFRAKRAGGDIKRVNGPDPYSYVSLGQASASANKSGKGGRGKVNLTNKKKGSRG